MRWALRGSGSPFACAECAESDKAERNCSNFKGLSEEARAVGAYSEEIIEELASKKCAKVVSLGGLRLYECPLSYINEETFEVMKTVFMMESSSRLYLDGGLADQPCWVVEALEIYQSEKARIAGEKNG